MMSISKLLFGFTVAVLFTVAADPVLAGSETFFTGGGILKEGQGRDARKITFSVNVHVDQDDQVSGHFQVNFQQLDDYYNLDKSRFTTAEFTDLVIATRDFVTPDDHFFVRLDAIGQLDGEDGWRVLARFADWGAPVHDPADSGNLADSVRIMLFAPFGGELVYDTARDYPREQVYRTLLDGGNVTVHFEVDPMSPPD